MMDGKGLTCIAEKEDIQFAAVKLFSRVYAAEAVVREPVRERRAVMRRILMSGKGSWRSCMYRKK